MRVRSEAPLECPACGNPALGRVAGYADGWELTLATDAIETCEVAAAKHERDGVAVYLH